MKAKRKGGSPILLRSLLTMKHKMMAYTTDSATIGQLLNSLDQMIERTTHQPGLIIASHHFCEPYPIVNQVDRLCLATMDLLIKFAYPSLSGYGKFTISFTMIRSYGEEISFTLGAAVPLTYQDGTLIPIGEVYAHIYRYIMKYAEIYDGDCVVRVMIHHEIIGIYKNILGEGS